jgi:hypothetical protein
MPRGSCLCGTVGWQVDGPVSDIECCHCSRCRKGTGAAFAPMAAVRRADFRFTGGEEEIREFAFPVRERPPAWRRAFCGRCGGPVPRVDPDFATLEIPAGCLDDDAGIRPLRHIYVAGAAPWFEFSDGLPRHERWAPRETAIEKSLPERTQGRSSSK